MKTSRDELLRETLVRYYWRLVCNGAKALADSARMHPMVVVLGTMAMVPSTTTIGCIRWLLYSAQLQLYICIVSAI